MNATVQRANDSHTGGAIVPLDLGVRYTLSGMFWLFVLISLELVVCSLFPLLVIVCVPLTVAGIRTSLLMGQRARLGNASSLADWLELYWGAVLMTFLGLLSFALAAIWGFSFGAAIEYVFVSGSKSYLVGGIIGMVLAAVATPFAWWRTIQSNWIFDLQAKSPEPRSQRELFSMNDRLQRFHFDLMTVFEITTYFAAMIVLGSSSPWLPLITAIPFVAAIIAAARFANTRRLAGEPVSLIDRYTVFLRAMALGFLFLLSIAVMFAAGYFVGSHLAAFLSASRTTPVVLGAIGGVLAGFATIYGWALFCREGLRRA